MKIVIIEKLYNKINNDKYYPFYILILSATVLFFKLNGSLVGWDEGIYSQIAKESLLSNNWIDLYYRGNLWFEKPPLIIWFTIISYKIFGINEFAVWFFPVVFGITGVLGTYYLAKYLFNSKIGLLSSLILLSIPHYVLLSRNNMTDIFLLTNSLFSFIFFIKSFDNRKYLIISSIFLALAFLSKNVISLLNLPIFLYYIHINKRYDIFRDKYLYISIIIFFMIMLPWHLIMVLKYKWEFVNNYFSYHIIERYNRNILNSIQFSDTFHYLKVIILRSASWWFAFFLIIPIVLKDIINKIKFKELKMLLFWIMLIFIIFSSSATKLHHYILQLYIPFSILIAYGLYNLYKRKSVVMLIIVFVLLMNISFDVMSRVSNFGESKLLLSYILHNFLNLPVHVIYGLVVLFISYIYYNYFSKNKLFAVKLALASIFISSFIIPFRPDRAPLAKEIGHLSLVNNADKLYYLDYFRYNDNLEGSLVFYSYPIPVKVINTKDKINFKENSLSYCLINKSFYAISKNYDYEYYPCEVFIQE